MAPAPDDEDPVRHPDRPLLAAVVGTALVLTACSTGGPATDPTASPTTEATTASPQDTQGRSPTDSPAGPSTGIPGLSSRCTLAGEDSGIDQVEFAVPGAWQVEGSCEFLDPSLDELEPGTQPDAAVSVRVEPVDFATAAAGDQLDAARRWLGARSGYQAVRLAGEASGEGARPAGQPTMRWLVDLDAGTDEAGGTLILTADPSEGASFERAAEAVDRIAQTVRVVPPASEDTVTITRVEGGGQPWAVTHDAADGCLRLRAGGPDGSPVDEACDLGAPDDGPVGAVLGDGDLQVVAGLASPLAVRVETDADATTAGSVTTATEGASLFAHPVPQVPADVRAVDAAGEEIGSANLE